LETNTFPGFCIEIKGILLLDKDSKMATYIDVLTEEEQVLELARLVNNLKTKGKEGDETFYEECAKLVDENKNYEVLDKLMDESKLVLTDDAEHVEGFFLVVIALLKKLGPDTSAKLVPKIITALTGTKDDKSSLRLKILNNTYNMMENIPTARYELLSNIIRFAGEIHNTQLLRALTKDIESFLKEINASVEQTRKIYKSVRDVLKSENLSTATHEWNVKYLSTFQGKDTSFSLDEAAEAAIQAIKIATLYQLDNLLELLPIQALADSKNAQHAKTLKLLKIFVGENLESYKSFINENPDFLKTSGLNHDDCMKKIRFLSLATLGASHQEVPYSLIATTLQIDESDVEMWVINAISEDILVAKMDQLKRVVVVSRSLQRVFNKTQWKQLNESLTHWKTNIRSLLNSLNETKQQHGFVISQP